MDLAVAILVRIGSEQLELVEPLLPVADAGERAEEVDVGAVLAAPGGAAGDHATEHARLSNRNRQWAMSSFSTLRISLGCSTRANWRSPPGGATARSGTAATSIAIEDPHHVTLIAALLGHARLATSERYYNMATTLEAAASYHRQLVEFYSR